MSEALVSFIGSRDDVDGMIGLGGSGGTSLVTPAMQTLTVGMYSYNFEKTPFDVDNYHATLRVRPITDGNKSFVEWSTTFDCDRDQIDKWQSFFSNEVFQGALNAVKEHFG